MKNVAIGLLGIRLDAGKTSRRWERWRPSVGLCWQKDLPIDRFELLCQAEHEEIGRQVAADIATVSPKTVVRIVPIQLRDPWDFEEVYGELLDFARGYNFQPERERYLIHIATGTHVSQICLFLLNEARYLPGVLIQTRMADDGVGAAGSYSLVDLDLSKYDRIASRFRQEQREGAEYLKGGIATRNRAFNEMMARIERVAVASRAPILLMGPTGAGKSQLARRIYDLRKARRHVAGPLVEVNCATLRGDGAMSALFGHCRGAFTGALEARAGLLVAANNGVLFLDEIGELGLDEQAMLLRAIEHKRFLPVGADKEKSSEFQLLAGTHRDLGARVREGLFREDLLARINLWTFRMPGLAERREDIAPNLDFELGRFAEENGSRVTMNKEARALFLKFAESAEATWTGNFRDLTGAVARMATLATDGRITVEVAKEEMSRLREQWQSRGDTERSAGILGPERYAGLDLFDRFQLEGVLRVCAQSSTLSDAGRKLFEASRRARSSVNDADRLRKYLARFGLTWAEAHGG